MGLAKARRLVDDITTLCSIGCERDRSSKRKIDAAEPSTALEIFYMDTTVQHAVKNECKENYKQMGTFLVKRTRVCTRKTFIQQKI